MGIFIIASVFLLSAGVVAFLQGARIGQLEKEVRDLRADLDAVAPPRRRTDLTGERRAEA